MELLVVMAIIGILATFSVPAFRTLTGAGTIDRAISDLSGYLEMSRAHAMANNTYVRVLFKQEINPNNERDVDLYVLAISPADGTLSNDSVQAMSNSDDWPAIFRPIILESIELDNSLNAGLLVTDETERPFTMADEVAGVSRRVKGQPVMLDEETDGAIQFQPSGEARARADTPSRSLAVGIRNPNQPRNPVLFHISGATGAIKILRAEDMDAIEGDQEEEEL